MFGKSRQAYYQRKKYIFKQEVKSEILLQLIARERKYMPRLGGRKLLKRIHSKLPEELQIGRDALFNFLREENLLVRRRKYKARTTYSNHWLHKYPNLIQAFTAQKANELWVSDITYIPTEEGFAYLSLLTDAYSRKILGWNVASTLEAIHSVKALKMALKQLPSKTENVYHHSDRGVQYCSDEYVKNLNKRNFQISMTESSDPRDNAIAERVNGIIKDEWVNQMHFTTKDEARIKMNEIIRIYNSMRPHSSVDMLTPETAHNQTGELKKHWKNYWKQKILSQNQMESSIFVKQKELRILNTL